MEDQFSLQDCNDDDILSFGDDIYKMGKFRKAVLQSFGNTLGSQLSQQLSHYGVKINGKILTPQGVNNPYERWFDKGMNCEILNLGSNGWQKGKVRIKVSVEFYIEEPEVPKTTASNEIIPPESPLDDLRQMMNQENS